MQRPPSQHEDSGYDLALEQPVMPYQLPLPAPELPEFRTEVMNFFRLSKTEEMVEQKQRDYTKGLLRTFNKLRTLDRDTLRSPPVLMNMLTSNDIPQELPVDLEPEILESLEGAAFEQRLDRLGHNLDDFLSSLGRRRASA
jgi:hypothetical protein